VAGILDHEAGCKDFLQTGGLRRALPVTTFFTALAALSLGGVLPLFGFIAKELMIEAVLEAPSVSGVLTALAVATAILGVLVAAIVGIRPWFGPRVETPKAPHEAPPAMLAGPAVLASLGLVFGLAPVLPEWGVLAAAAGAVYGAPLDPHLALWHGVNTPLMISAAGLLLGLLLYTQWARFRAAFAWLDGVAGSIGPERQYDRGMAALAAISEWQTRVLQNGYLRYYLMTILLMTLVLVGVSSQVYDISVGRLSLDGVQLHEAVILGVLLAAAVVAVTIGSRLGAVASVGAVGFGVALIYVLFSAPDVGITQVLVETLTVLLLVLVLFRLPGFLDLSTPLVRLRDAAIAIAVGSMMTLLMLSTLHTRLYDSISAYFVAESGPSGHGRNIVNVILVDFRALDTLGEIFVLALAAVGVYAMIKLRAEDSK
jgi:multicomponent Na+:H+ antiporter subunit A